MKVKFNTGRLYRPEGQIIEAELIGDVVLFRDLTRRIDGAFRVERPDLYRYSASALEREVMARYDRNLYADPHAFPALRCRNLT